MSVIEPLRETPMYEDFYGFAQSPFTLAPDPRFLYLSTAHDEAIRLLLQAIRRKEGFIVLAGDIGTGKTTLCRAVIEQLDQSTFTSLVLNPFLTAEELLREILLDFGVVSRETARTGRLATATRHELISTLHDFLLSLVPVGAVAVLIIDEAQNLSPEVLEQIRVISNLETNDGKLLQIVLVGQLNLLETLRDSRMRQLDQRVSLRAMLGPLTRSEMEAYIGHRLGVASGWSSVTFDRGALDAVHAFSGGVPRVINLLCDRALMIGAETGSSVITAAMVRKAAKALALAPQRTSARLPRWAAVTGIVLGLLTAAAAGALYLVPFDRAMPAPLPPSPTSPPPPRFGQPLPAMFAPAVTPPLYPPAPADAAPAPVAPTPLPPSIAPAAEN